MITTVCDFLDVDALEVYICAVAEEYEHTSPALSSWVNDLYVQVHQDAEAIKFADILFLRKLHADGTWMHPNYAQNQLYHMLERTGRNTGGMIDF